MKNDPRCFYKKVKTKINKLFTKSNWNLFVELVRADFKVTDHNSFLGILWSFLGPAAMWIVMCFIFKARFGRGVYAYPLYLLVGIVSVSFFVTATTYMIRIFLINREIILNSTIPREILIFSNLFIHAYKFIIELILCWILSIFYGVFSWKLFFLFLPLLVVYIVFVLGVSLIISLVYCFARDIEHIWTLVSRLLFFVTPIFYTLDSISLWARKLVYWCNPLTPFLVSFQRVFIGGINMQIYFYSLLLGCSFFIVGYYSFVTFENAAVERA